mmetsp:Transcript_70549/g.131994  ORF Transcript_70549/g.131994 Transcript_70549/m.131994 type:complete len:340 (+) Transcript_70549:115-1134(+)
MAEGVPPPPDDFGEKAGEQSEEKKTVEEATAEKPGSIEEEEEPTKAANPDEVGSATGSTTSKRMSLRGGLDFLKDKSKAISESDRVQQLKAKTEDIAGSVKNKTKELADLQMVKSVSAKVANLRAGKTEEENPVKLQTSSEALGANAWKGSAKETLSSILQEPQWSNVKMLAAEEIAVSARGEHITSHFVEKGSRLQWSFRLKEHSVNFAVRIRSQGEGEEAQEEDMLKSTKCDAGSTMSCSWVADEDSSVRLVFDNKTSMLKGKTIAYIVGIGPASGATAANSAEAAQDAPAATAPGSSADADSTVAETAASADATTEPPPEATKVQDADATEQSADK